MSDILKETLFIKSTVPIHSVVEALMDDFDHKQIIQVVAAIDEAAMDVDLTCELIKILLDALKKEAIREPKLHVLILETEEKVAKIAKIF